MQVNAIIGSTDPSGKKINTTISYLRESQKSKARNLAVALNALTTNTFENVQVNEINVDIAGKTEPTLSISGWSTGENYAYTTVTYNGDGQLFVQCSAPANIDQTNRLLVQGRNATGTIYATEGNNYAAKTLTFTTD